MREMGCDDPDGVLHVCSGSMRSGVTLDIRRSCSPGIVGDCRSLPFRSGSFGFVLVDPPYSKDYASNLYGVGESYPRPGSVLKEVSRVLKSGGKVGFLHFQVPMIRKPLKIKGVYGVTTGCGYAIRAWTLMEKERGMVLVK